MKPISHLPTVVIVHHPSIPVFFFKLGTKWCVVNIIVIILIPESISFRFLSSLISIYKVHLHLKWINCHIIVEIPNYVRPALFYCNVYVLLLIIICIICEHLRCKNTPVVTSYCCIKVSWVHSFHSTYINSIQNCTLNIRSMLSFILVQIMSVLICLCILAFFIIIHLRIFIVINWVEENKHFPVFHH